MTVSREDLINNYISSFEDKNAALFIGAGMSRSSGFVDWKGLLRECAKYLNLDLGREHDLVAVAQYYINKKRDRSRLNQIISEDFGRPVEPTENHKIISRLPISTIWTTNFDSLIEDALRANGRTVDAKSRDQDVTRHLNRRDCVVYKMHGDISRPDKVIICKDDYERYSKSHYILQQALEGDLISKTFLFLGFSFSDPNLEYMLGHLRTLLEESKREHYTIMRKARINWVKEKENKDEAHRAFLYEKNKQELQIDDLKRYGIETYLVDKFSEITDILLDIEKIYQRKNVFVSGSARVFGELDEDKIRDFCVELGEHLVEKGYHLVSGSGLNIGDSVVKGSLLKLFEQKEPSIEKMLTVRPFPRIFPDDIEEAEFNRNYREAMIKDCGFAIFISGNSRTQPERSQGVMEEYQIAKELNKIIIPVGATGFAAKHIWEEMRPDIDKYYSNQVESSLFEKLNDPTLNISELLKTVFDIMKIFRHSNGTRALE